jgi:hypothetical protein
LQIKWDYNKEQATTKWLPLALFLGVKRQGCKSNHSTAIIADVKTDGCIHPCLSNLAQG